MALPNQLLLLLLAFLVSLSLFSTNHSSPAAAEASVSAGTTNADFIKASCESTTYPHLCYTSLSSHASEIGADPEILAQTALTVAVQSANSTAAALSRMAARSFNFTHREAGAMRDCLEELRDSVAQIRNSMKEMKQLGGHLSGPEFAMKMSDVETWVSAALTDEDTCSDGFAGKALDGNLKTAVRQLIRKVARLTSNALALINSFAAHHQ